MNVTKHGYKGRKLHKEDCPRMVVAEQREYVEVPAHVRIAEHNDIITRLVSGQFAEEDFIARQYE